MLLSCGAERVILFETMLLIRREERRAEPSPTERAAMGGWATWLQTPGWSSPREGCVLASLRTDIRDGRA